MIKVRVKAQRVGEPLRDWTGVTMVEGVTENISSCFSPHAVQPAAFL